MNTYEVPAMLEDELPAISEELRRECTTGNIHATILALVKYTRKMINLRNVQEINKCMTLADKLYRKGNNLVKNAVENVFVYSFSGLRAACNLKEWKAIQAKMPLSLYSLYVKQIYRSGI